MVAKWCDIVQIPSEALKREEIDGSALLSLTDSELKSLDLPVTETRRQIKTLCVIWSRFGSEQAS